MDGPAVNGDAPNAAGGIRAAQTRASKGRAHTSSFNARRGPKIRSSNGVAQGHLIRILRKTAVDHGHPRSPSVN
jgi:hypothetical protein